MYRIYLALLFLLNTVFLNSQTIVKGITLSTDKQPKSSASITLFDSLNGNILAYAISNAKGEFKMEVTAEVKEFLLQVRAFNFAFGCTAMIVTLSCGAQYEDCIYGDYLGFLIGMLTWIDMNNTYCPAPQPGTPVYFA